MTTTTHDTFAQRLRAARKDSNLSQRRLAKLLHTTDNHVWMWESGRRLPDFSNIVKLSLALGISADRLLGLEE
jgi:transcriptional regulator with XRE-family HTH domain